MNNNTDKINVRKILIFKLCCFGDIIQLTPAINALYRNYPDAKISIIASSWIQQLAPFLGHINDIIIFDAPYEKNVLKKIFKTIGIIFRLRKEKFDLCLLGHRKIIFGLILKLAGIKFRLGFKGTKYLTHSAEFDPNVHETFRYLKILDSANIEYENVPVKLVQLKDKEKIKAENALPTGKLILGIFPFGGSNPGSEMHIKRWGLENYINLIDRLRNDDRLEIILFEGTLEDEIVNTNNLPPNIIKKKINLDLLSICDIFMSGDTGPLHIAAAFGANTIAIFGPSDPTLVAPINYPGTEFSHEYIWLKPECSPCYTTITAFETSNTKYWKDKTFICWTGTHKCIEDITVENVYQKVTLILNRLKN